MPLGSSAALNCSSYLPAGLSSFTRVAISFPRTSYTFKSNGFTPDDTGFIGTYADLSKTGGSGLAGDIYTSGLNGDNLRQLTQTPRQPDEDPCYSPDGKKIAFKHLTRYPATDDELYLMDADGSNQIKLTNFTTLGNPEYDPFAGQNTEHTWSPDGSRIVVGHVSNINPRPGPHIPSTLYEVTFEGACGKDQ